MRTQLKLVSIMLVCFVAVLPSGHGFQTAQIEMRTFNAYAQQACLPPKADAGPDQSVQVGQTVQLDGSKSSQPTSRTGSLSFGWAFVSEPSDSQAKLSDPASAKPTFVADVVGESMLRSMVRNGAGLNV